MQYGEEASLGADLRHTVNQYFAYHAGVHASIYHNDKTYFGIDPRITFQLTPAENQEITLHGGCYTQYFHKAGLTGGGLPTDFFLLADSTFKPERAIATSLRYSASFLNKRKKMRKDTAAAISISVANYLTIYYKKCFYKHIIKDF